MVVIRLGGRTAINTTLMVRPEQRLDMLHRITTAFEYWSVPAMRNA